MTVKVIRKDNPLPPINLVIHDLGEDFNSVKANNHSGKVRIAIFDSIRVLGYAVFNLEDFKEFSARVIEMMEQ